MRLTRLNAVSSEFILESSQGQLLKLTKEDLSELAKKLAIFLDITEFRRGSTGIQAVVGEGDYQYIHLCYSDQAKELSRVIKNLVKDDEDPEDHRPYCPCSHCDMCCEYEDCTCY